MSGNDQLVKIHYKISAVSKVDFDFLEHLIEELRAADLNDKERKLVEKFFKSAPRCPVLEELLPFCYLSGRVSHQVEVLSCSLYRVDYTLIL